MPITKVQRWIDLIAYLVSRRLPVRVEELMENVPAYRDAWHEDETSQASARRMFERDKDELRRAGIPIQTVPYSVNFGTEQYEGYQISRRDFYLPYLRILEQATPAPPARGDRGRVTELMLSQRDAVTALHALQRVAGLPQFPLARDARSAFRKLAFDIDPSALSSREDVLFVERPGAAEETQLLRELSDSLFARKQVEFDYRGMYRGAATKRVVFPYGLMFHRGTWYLIGHDRTRDAIRVFRVARIDSLAVNRRSLNTPDYSIPPDFKVSDYAGRDAWELGGEDETPIVADILFRFPLSLWAERNHHGRPVEQRSDGSSVRAFDVVQVQPFLRWLLSFEGEAQVLTPPELRAALRELAREVAAVYGGGRDA